jgi:hypothetical protein
LQLPLGPTYERIILNLGGTLTKALITDIRVKINGRVIHQCSGADLDAMNSFTGMAADASMLTIDFTEIYARDATGQTVGALGTAAGVASAIIEFDLGAGATHSLTAFSVTSGAKQLGVVNKLLKYTFQVGASGTPWNVPLPFGLSGGSLVKRIYLKPSTGTVDRLAIKANGVEIFNASRQVNEFWQRENRKTPQAGWFVFDQVVDCNMLDMFNTSELTSFEVNPTCSAVNTLTVYVEYVDALANL